MKFARKTLHTRTEFLIVSEARLKLGYAARLFRKVPPITYRHISSYHMSNDSRTNWNFLKILSDSDQCFGDISPYFYIKFKKKKVAQLIEIEFQIPPVASRNGNIAKYLTFTKGAAGRQ